MTVDPMPAPALERTAEELENSERLDPLAAWLERVAGAVLPNGRLLEELRGRSLGHALHPVLTDLPIGFWAAASLLDLTGAEKHAKAARTLVGAGVILVVPTALAGLSDWVRLRSTASRRVGAAHATLNAVGGSIFATSWLLRQRGRTGAGVAVALLGNVVVSFSGQLGGHLTLRRNEPNASALEVV
jgi:uncharacterized membrane protein